MPDQEEERTAERVDRLVEELVSGGRLKATPSDASDHTAIMSAAGLAGATQPYPRMHPAFKRRLESLLQGQPDPSLLSRRAALLAGLGVGLGALTGAVAERLVRVRGVTVPQSSARAVHATAAGEEIPAIINPLPSTQKWWDTGVRAEDLVENVPVRVSAGSVGAFILRRGNQVVGMSAYCTHLPCELDWMAESHVLNCPCHNSAFDLNGESLGKTYKWPTLPAVSVRVTDGTVEVLGTA
jgi:nitrite reductase/ring-hydroxylating ferredoxin subunit